jgi:hypothetical protein
VRRLFWTWLPTAFGASMLCHKGVDQTVGA